MNKTLKILSIDWDYFINASLEQRMLLFPDCPSENYSKAIQNLIWSGRYSDPKLTKININQQALNKLEKFLLNIKKPIYLAETHTFCYHLIKTKKQPHQKLILTNIDHHHDIYNKSNKEEINCGNWLYHIIKDHPTGEYTWLKNTDSELYNKNKITKKLKITDNIDTILNQDYDIIFICQSAMWSPPHLDKHLHNMLYKIIDKTITLQNQIWENRNFD